MKKNVMALSIAAMIGGLGFAGAASADVIVGTFAGASTAASIAAGTLAKPTANNLEVTRAGVGHALVVPYFNAQNGNMTVLHVTNTDQVNGKVAKVRFRSASNSDDLLDFQVFLSPGDVWTAAVTADANGLAQIVTADNTCTVPALTSGVAQPFNNSSARLPSYLTEAQRNALTREGYVEIFNVADITAVKAWDNNGALAAAGPNRSPLYNATKHSNGVAPCSVAGSAARTLLNNAAIADYQTELAAATAGLDSSTGGLMGDWYIINVPQTTTFSGAATAIVANTGAGTAGAIGNFRHFAQLGNNLVTGNADGANGVTADPLFRNVNVFDATGAKVTTAALTMLNYDAPDLSTPFFSAASSANTLAQSTNLLTALSVKSITNQYALDASITAKTDWVFSMPARRYNVAANYAAVTGTTGATGPTTANAKYRLFTDLNADATQQGEWFYPAVNAGVYAANAVPGNTYKAGGNTTVDANGNICVFADGQKFYDREETSATAGPVFSPGTASSVSFCGEVSVLAFQDTGTSVLGASVARNTVTSGFYTNGWGVIDTTNAAQGLPLVGEAFIKLSNPQAGTGVSGTYGINWAHRFTK